MGSRWAAFSVVRRSALSTAAQGGGADRWGFAEPQEEGGATPREQRFAPFRPFYHHHGVGFSEKFIQADIRQFRGMFDPVGIHMHELADLAPAFFNVVDAHEEERRAADTVPYAQTLGEPACQHGLSCPQFAGDGQHFAPAQASSEALTKTMGLFRGIGKKVVHELSAEIVDIFFDCCGPVHGRQPAVPLPGALKWCSELQP